MRALPLFSSTVTIKQHFKSRGDWLWASASSLEAWCSWLHYLPGFTVNRRVNLGYIGVFAPAMWGPFRACHDSRSTFCNASQRSLSHRSPCLAPHPRQPTKACPVSPDAAT